MPSLDTAVIVLAGITLLAAFVNGALGYGFSSVAEHGGGYWLLDITRLALRHLDRGNHRGDYRGERAGYAAASSTPVLEAVDIIISLAGARLWRRHAAFVQLDERHLLFAFGPACPPLRPVV